MIPLIIWLIGLFAWLGYETDWLRVRLPVGILSQVELSCTLPIAAWLNTFAVYSHHNVALFMRREISDDQYNKWHNGHKHWDIVLSCGVEPMCGQKWIDKHYHDLDDYVPHIEFSVPNYKQSFNLRNQRKLKQILTANFRDKRELRTRISIELSCPLPRVQISIGGK